MSEQVKNLLGGSSYNPDVLECLANLSNDEVFTPPKVVNSMLDMLPPETWTNPNLTFLDPACKTGVFLREIAKRLIDGLADQIPDLQERLDHIFHKQLYGIAITELTALASRRSLYCSKYANGKYSVSSFDNPDGNIRFTSIGHTWEYGKCKFCGASEEQYSRGSDLETHAYEFIHTNNPEEIFGMKFDVIIGNPPYQMIVNRNTKQSVPLYHKFIMLSKKMRPKYLSMIVPSRWFSGGIGLDEFRNEMKSENKLRIIVDYKNEKECFNGVDIAGGVNYFLWERDYCGPCTIINKSTDEEISEQRSLDEFSFIVRDNRAVDIIHKILSKNEKKLSENGCSVQTPYGFLSTFVGDKQPVFENDCRLYTSKGWQFVRRNSVLKSKDTIDIYKPFISKLSCEHAGTPDKNGMYRVISKHGILLPKEICNQSYLTICPQDSKEKAANVLSYLRTKIVRFLIQSTLIGMNISQSNFQFVPWQDFSKKWTDEELIKKYGISEEEYAHISSVIREMEDN